MRLASVRPTSIGGCHVPQQRSYREVGIDYLDSAPVRAALRQPLPVSAETVFAAFEEPDFWTSWIGPLEEVVWTSPKPFGVGTTRDVIGRGSRISEEFIAWQAPRRIAFYFTEGDSPLFAALAEEYTLEPRGDRCELVWRYAFECPDRLRLLQRVVAFGFKQFGTRGLKKMAAHLAEHPDRYGKAAA